MAEIQNYLYVKEGYLGSSTERGHGNIGQRVADDNATLESYGCVVSKINEINKV